MRCCIPTTGSMHEYHLSRYCCLFNHKSEYLSLLSFNYFLTLKTQFSECCVQQQCTSQLFRAFIAYPVFCLTVIQRSHFVSHLQSFFSHFLISTRSGLCSSSVFHSELLLRDHRLCFLLKYSYITDACNSHHWVLDSSHCLN